LVLLCEDPKKDNSDEISKILSETPDNILEKIINEQTLSNTITIQVPNYNHVDLLPEMEMCQYATILYMACYNLKVETMRVLLTHEKTKNIIDVECLCTDRCLNLSECLTGLQQDFTSMGQKEIPEEIDEINKLLSTVKHTRCPVDVV
jgi:hypothetical protein